MALRLKAYVGHLVRWKQVNVLDAAQKHFPFDPKKARRYNRVHRSVMTIRPRVRPVITE